MYGMTINIIIVGFWSLSQAIAFYVTFRACSHGGGGPQVGEVPHLPVVKES